MIKKCLLLLSGLLISFMSFAQKQYELTIKVNNTIEKDKLSFSVDADKRNISVQDKGNNQMKVTGELIDEAIPLTIEYNQAASTFILTEQKYCFSTGRPVEPTNINASCSYHISR